MKKKELEKKKKFIMELLKDPNILSRSRLREIASLLRLDKGQKKELYEVMDSSLEEERFLLIKGKI